MKTSDRIPLTFAPALVSAYITLCGKTTKWKVAGLEPVKEMTVRKKPVIFTFWHNQIMLISYFYNKILGGNKGVSLISLSKDGELISRAMKKQKIGYVRGSSSRRGGQALIGLAQKIQEGYDVAITPDGPRGPCYEVQPGAVLLASRTGVPIVPVAYDIKWKKVLKTWDCFRFPFPFSEGNIVLGDLFYVSDDPDPGNLDNANRELKNRLNAVHQRAQEH